MQAFLKALWAVLERVADMVELDPQVPHAHVAPRVMYDINGVPTMDRNLALFPG